MPELTGLDHFVLTASDPEATIAFYTRVLGMTLERFTAADGTTRSALLFGGHKINIHDAAQPFAPHAAHPLPGSQDFCLLTEAPIEDWIDRFAQQGVAVEEGPVARTGARGPLTSVYVRDPDGNLVEVARYG